MRKIQKERQKGVDVRNGTAYEVPLEDGSVDAVICSQVRRDLGKSYLTSVVSLVWEWKGFE